MKRDNLFTLYSIRTKNKIDDWYLFFNPLTKSFNKGATSAPLFTKREAEHLSKLADLEVDVVPTRYIPKEALQKAYEGYYIIHDTEKEIAWRPEGSEERVYYNLFDAKVARDKYELDLDRYIVTQINIYDAQRLSWRQFIKDFEGDKNNEN